MGGRQRPRRPAAGAEVGCDPLPDDPFRKDPNWRPTPRPASRRAPVAARKTAAAAAATANGGLSTHRREGARGHPSRADGGPRRRLHRPSARPPARRDRRRPGARERARRASTPGMAKELQRARARRRPRRPHDRARVAARRLRRLGGQRRGGQLARRRPRPPDDRGRPRHRRRRAGRPHPEDGADDRGPAGQGRVLAHRPDRQRDGRPARLLRRRGDARGARGRHRRQARRPGRGQGRLAARGAT